jgi:hypothetical protein
MHTVKHHLKQTLACSLVIVSTVFSIDGKTDLKSEQEFLKARVKNIEQHSEHAEHQQVIDKSTDFHGVFYGYLPCQDCNGVKITLSLKQKNLYLLVTQSAKESSREFYEKGKYQWDDATQTVLLTPRDKGTPHYYRIENDETLVKLSDDGKPLPVNQKDRYTLRRSDTVQNREVHIH